MTRGKNGSPFVKEMKTDMKKEEGKTPFCVCLCFMLSNKGSNNK